MACVLVVALALSAVPQSRANAGSGPPHFSAAFSDHYIGVLYRSGRYRVATALAKSLLDGSWIRKETACANAVMRAYLVVQIHRRFGRDPHSLGVLGAQVHALRYWVRGPGAAILPPAAVIAESEPLRPSRVMGWTSTGLAATAPVPLGSSPVLDYAAPSAVALLDATVISQDVQLSKTVVAPLPKAVPEPRPSAKPGARAHKPKASARMAVTAPDKPAEPAPQGDGWMDRVFVN